MKLVRCGLFGVLLTVVCGSSTQAAVAQLVCSSNSTTITANLSFVDIGITIASGSGSGSSGAGAGKATLNPLEVHTAAANFPVFFQNAAQGTIFTSCTVTTNVAAGSIVYNLKTVQITSVDAIARAARSTDEKPANYTDVKLTYAALEVISNSATDDGGTD